MNTFLNHHIVIETLTAERDSLGRFRGGDERGACGIVVANTDVQHVEYAAFAKPGIGRGFHFHKEVVKRIYVMEGRLRFAACLVDDPSSAISLILEPGQLLTIQPLTAHAFLSLEPALLLVMATGPYPFEDRERYEGLRFEEARI